MRLSLDWMNLFGGLSSHQVVSVIVVAIIFSGAAGLTCDEHLQASLFETRGEPRSSP